MRKYCLTIDQLMSVDLVTADGQVVTASATQNADLFWGSAVVAATSASWSTSNSDSTRPDRRSWRGRSGGTWLTHRASWGSTATESAMGPDELTTVVIHRRVAAVPVMPVELHGKRVVMVIGDLQEGDRFVRPLRNFGGPLLDLWKPKPQAMFDQAFL
jgi:hypothetical protein